MDTAGRIREVGEVLQCCCIVYCLKFKGRMDRSIKIASVRYRIVIWSINVSTDVSKICVKCISHVFLIGANIAIYQNSVR